MTSAQAAGGSWPDAGEFKRAAQEVFMKVNAAWQQGGHHHHHREGPSEGGGPHERRHRGRGGGHRGFPFDFGRGPWDMRPGGPFGGRQGFGRGRKAKRGDVRAAILALLTEGPRNGYQIIQEIAERSEGGWKPSPGAVYPALQQLTDEGLVVSEENEGGRKAFHLTEAGRAYVDSHPDEVNAPWDEMRPDIDDNTQDVMDIAKQSAFAMMQILHSGTDAQIREARKALADTRRKLYQILADGDPGEE